MQVTLNNSKKKALVDKRDFARVSKYTWLLDAGRVKRTDRSGLFLSRFLLRVKDPNIFVDHKDHDLLNHRRGNLRRATQAQNRYNSKKPLGRLTSKYKGVNRHRSRWEASITFHGQQRYLGSFVSESLAAQVYDSFALTFFGEFARLNFPKRRRFYRTWQPPAKLRLSVRLCAHCGKPFTPVWAKSKFHNRACKEADAVKQKRKASNVSK